MVDLGLPRRVGVECLANEAVYILLLIGTEIGQHHPPIASVCLLRLQQAFWINLWLPALVPDFA
jgi:hypothetical protein